MRMSQIIKKIILVIIFLYLIFLGAGCYTIRETNYYADKNNYISVEGTVIDFAYSDDNTKLFICFSDLSYPFDDFTFILEGDNLKIVENNAILEKIEIGSRVSFTTAPKYFGDGYAMPIVAISINGESLLAFDEGYENLMELYGFWGKISS